MMCKFQTIPLEKNCDLENSLEEGVQISQNNNLVLFNHNCFKVCISLLCCIVNDQLYCSTCMNYYNITNCIISHNTYCVYQQFISSLSNLICVQRKQILYYISLDCECTNEYNCQNIDLMCEGILPLSDNE